LASPVDIAVRVPDGQRSVRRRPAATSAFLVALWTARVMLIGQLAWMIGFSTLVYARGRITYDFGSFYQPAWLIAHGHLNPIETLQDFSFWKVNGDWIMWPLAPIVRLPGGGLWLLWAQDLVVFGCGWVAVQWVAELARSPRWNSRLWPWAAVLLVAVLFVGNPWVYSSDAFDFHFEAFTAFFAILAAWDLSRGRTRRLWIWVALTLLSHVLGAIVIVGVGLAGLVAGGRDKRRTSLLVLGAGLAWFVFMSVIHADQASPLVSGYGYLAGPTIPHPSESQMVLGAITHPSRLLGQVWSNRDNIWANFSPAGFIGVLSPWALFPAILAYAPGLLFRGHPFALPMFQNVVVYPFVAVGTVLVLRWIGARRGLYARATPVMCLVLAALTAGWAWAFLPTYWQPYLQIPPSGSRALATVRHLIPANATVVASDLVAGRFAGREHLYSVPERIPLDGKPVYFVIITHPVYDLAGTDAFLEQAASLGSQLLFRQNGLWVLRWTPPANQHSIVIEGASWGTPGWALTPSSAGTVVMTGPPSTWRVQSDGRPGVVAAGGELENPGRYLATVDLAIDGEATVKVVVAQTGQVLASRTVYGTGQRQSIVVPFTQSKNLPYLPGTSGFNGSGIFKLFRVQSTGSPPTQDIQVYIVNPGGATISGYRLNVRPAG
jgi:uncharacterized membrane protein